MYVIWLIFRQESERIDSPTMEKTKKEGYTKNKGDRFDKRPYRQGNGKNDFLDSTLWPIFLETCKSHLDSVILKEAAAQAEANKI